MSSETNFVRQSLNEHRHNSNYKHCHRPINEFVTLLNYLKDPFIRILLGPK